MKFYRGQFFDDFTTEKKTSIGIEIKGQTDSYILNVNVDDFTNHLAQKNLLDIPQLHFNDTSAEVIEKDIPGTKFPRFDFMGIDASKSYRKEVVIYHIPYSGNINLLELVPNPRVMMSFDAEVDSRKKCILVEIINLYNDPEKIKYSYEQQRRDLNSNYEYLKGNCESFNDNLPGFIRDEIEKRKRQVLQKNSLAASLGVPIRSKENIAESFSVPNPKLKEKIVVKPSVADNDYKPEPALDEATYKKILKIISDVGQNFERMPSTYKGKSEEDIRDHILLVLDPNFELGSAGGETFNKSGKTDISLRYDSSVVFVAECKYWGGEKVYLKTIDQLLGYLTWRNSKVAVINFVRTAEFSDVLSKTKKATMLHPNFLKEMTDSGESWFNYKFHLNGDRNREIDMAVISFHLPKLI